MSSLLHKNDHREKMITHHDIACTLESKNWIFAKTMPQNPHWYTLRRQWLDDDAFDDVVKFIRANGYKEKFKKNWYTLLNLNGYKYWTMGAPIDQTILINRKPVDYQSEYDGIADVYDKQFSDPDSIAENQRIVASINLTGSVLDIGCGSGVLLDTIPIEDYTGIDTSKSMLQQLMLKHPHKGSNLIHTPFEEFYGKTFDTVVSLFGAASYIMPEFLGKVNEMLTDTGTAFLMFYADHYTPKTHIINNIHPTIYKNEYDGEIDGNYKIVRLKSD